MLKTHSLIIFVLLSSIIFGGLFLLYSPGFFSNYIYAGSNDTFKGSNDTDPCAGVTSCTTQCMGVCSAGYYCSTTYGTGCLPCPACQSGLNSPYSSCTGDSRLDGTPCDSILAGIGQCLSGVCYTSSVPYPTSPTGYPYSSFTCEPIPPKFWCTGTMHVGDCDGPVVNTGLVTCCHLCPGSDPTETCVDEPPCTDGATESCPCGGTKTCTAGVWSDCPGQHTDCVNGVCQCVSGAGQDTCLNLNHACIWGCNDSQQCALGVTGPSCVTDADCQSQPTCGFDSQGDLACFAGGGGTYCIQDSDCNPEQNPAIALNCNDNQQCVPGGSITTCTGNTDTNAEDQPRCNDDNECVASGGTGVTCPSIDSAGDDYCVTHLASSTYCSIPTATTYSQCVFGGDSGIPCSSAYDCFGGAFTCDPNTNSCGEGVYSSVPCLTSSDCGSGCVTVLGPSCAEDLDCQQKPKCKGSKCVAGGEGAYCPSIDAAGNTFCASLATSCDSNGQCVSGGSGPSCLTNADCAKYPTCSSYGTCVVGGGTNACSVYGTDCSSIPFGCNADQQCVRGGSGPSCATDFDCQSELSCRNANACTLGGGGAYCSVNADCEVASDEPDEDDPDCPSATNCSGLQLGCDSDQHCVPGGIGPSCDSTGDCQHYNTCNSDHQCVLHGGGAYCSEPADCSGLPYACNADQQCVPGGIGPSCDYMTKGNDDCTGYKTCDVDGSGNARCLVGGGGAYCPSANSVGDTYCESFTVSCNNNGQCVPGGNGFSCTADADCLNEPPTVDSLSVDSGPYCSFIPGTGLATFRWNYTDTENDDEVGWRLQIRTGPSLFDDIVYDSCRNGTCGTNGSATSKPIYVLPSSTDSDQDHIHYGESYYWGVKVWEAVTGYDSGWVYYSGSYTYPYLHLAPAVSYQVPTNIYPGAQVTFVDNSVCHNNDDSWYYCKDPSACYNADNSSHTCPTSPTTTYSWWFDSVNSTSPDNTVDKAAATHAYSQSGTYSTVLQVCDGLAPTYCCSNTANVNVGSINPKTVPQWKEVSPFQ